MTDEEIYQWVQNIREQVPDASLKDMFHDMSLDIVPLYGLTISSGQLQAAYYRHKKIVDSKSLEEVPEGDSTPLSVLLRVKQRGKMKDEEVYEHVREQIVDSGVTIAGAVADVVKQMNYEWTTGQVQAAYYRHKKIVDSKSLEEVPEGGSTPLSVLLLRDLLLRIDNLYIDTEGILREVEDLEQRVAEADKLKEAVRILGL